MDARRVQIFHRLDSDNSAVFLSPPVWNQHDGALQLKFSHFIQDPQRYVEKAGDVAYIVYKEYNVDHQRKAVDEQIKANVALPPPEPSEYHVQLVFRDTVSAMTTFLDSLPTFRADFPGFDESDLMHGPFTWWFHCRKSYDLTLIGPYQARLVSQLINTIEEIYGELYDRVIDQFAEGKVSQWSLEYLVRPGTVLLRRVGPLTLGCLAIGCTLSVQEKDNTASLSVDTRSIVFDGLFRRNFERHVIDIPNDGEVDIKSLKLFPLDFAEPGTRERLSRRGRTYWKCRQQRFVSCQEQSDSQEGERFMVDFETYKELHPDNSYTKTIFLPGKNYYKDSSLPDNDCDPEEPDIFLFPAVIPGFDFRRKKWKEIEVDKIRDVVWNDEAFSHLVADEDMKELIEALVSKQLAAETSTDLIKNKGNGLIMLLHGSPGTGKTFTAESVAELARKPLYPVTCGDIGTEPEKVENYLESIFHLGKKWNCVMLLDEAEVFLEQRTLQDLHRNALVSVFLRALEYYDGILILTTNRVGTFDEAFKSRIQISLPYKKLDRAQRKQIWRNFLGRLQGLGQHGTIDFDDIEAHLDDLADYSMNGRQIRNAITTARQLAEFRNKKMNFASLKKTIGVSEKFDKYLADVREGDVRELLGDGKEGRHSDDIIARENELR
ncbi:P-loop containing nucleoside triphosphate hydrolase protein [Microdochium trichocladiopsis]|uniref:P-loop containing nucleoside triphosphate hydrolase protein n=1 Tax=Microdochium trichocladiopsis TaxID=1682393 RepID=A0A9P9BX80_9PEZI|nr:P-loop containing nucleoside triphosphate hydrolase protein [Microdochium trichocladiopsis]KAH7035821.1 P-loop containing nucleoside triphosphate hydrolase protein [Microdochium trichocladiopsis]